MTPRPTYTYPVWIVWVLCVPTLLIVAGVAYIGLSDDVQSGLGAFDGLDWWWLCFLVPGAGLVYIYGLWRKRRAMARFVSGSLAPLLTPQLSAARQAARGGLLVLSVLLLVVAIIGPRWGLYLEKQEAHGIDIVVALDVSRSMLARDVAPSRLERSKRLIQEQLTDRWVAGRANRLGLLVFAGSTSMKVPLTLDHGFFRRALSDVHIGSAPRGGTAIARAILDATTFFATSPKGATKILLLVTDGEDHEGDAIAAAVEASEEYGITIFTIGVGDPALTAGAKVPGGAGVGGGPAAGVMLHQGQIVFSKLDVEALRQVAQAGGGGSYAALDDLPHVVDALRDMQKRQLSGEERKRHKPRYQWFLAVALLLMAVEPMIGECKPAGEAMTRVWSFSVNDKTP